MSATGDALEELDRLRELLPRAHKWLTDMMVDGEYGRRECCWTNPDKEGHKTGCELEALMKELERLAREVSDG